VSITEGFFSEVAEEVRRDRMYRLWRRYGPWIVGALALMVVAGAAWEWRERAAEDDARSRMEDYLAAEGLEDAAESAKALADFADQSAAAGQPGYAILSRLRGAARRVEAGDLEGALREYQAVEADPDASELFREIARLRILLVRAADLDPEELAAGFQPLAAEGRPLRRVAGELRLYALMSAGDVDTALAEAEALLADSDLSGSMRGRVDTLMRVAEESAEAGGEGA